MIKAHADDYQALRFTPHIWRDGRCSYCGSIHPDDLLVILKHPDAKLSGSDWKYGWPHKFYIDIPTQQPDPNRQGTLEYHTGKWYNSHLKDDDVPQELFEILAERSRIRFKVIEQGIAYIAPWSGFQIYPQLVNIPSIPDWPEGK